MFHSKNCELTQCYHNIQDVATHLAELKYNEEKFDIVFNEMNVFLRDNNILRAQYHEQTNFKMLLII